MLRKLLILIILPLLLCSCSRDNREVITFSSWGSATETKILSKIINDFETENPEIKVNFLYIPQNYFQKIHLLFASSTPPDVIFINNLYLPVYANELEDVSEIVNEQDYYPQTIDVMSIKGKLLAVPRDVSNLVFYYNKKMIPYINKNWTFTDFENILKKYKTDKFYQISFERDVYMAEPYIMALGNENGIKFYKNLEGIYAPMPAQIGSSTLAQMFLDEKIMLYLSGRWMYPKIKETAKFSFGIVPFPGISPTDSSGWAIPKKSKHKNASKIFIKYLASDKNMQYFADTGLIVPAKKNIPYEMQDIFNLAIRNSKPHIVTPKYRKERDELNKELFD